MSDNLTKKLQKQLEARGTIASTTQINRALETLSEENENSLDSGSLFNPSVTAEEEPQSPPQQQNRFEDFLSVAEQAGITEKQDSSSVLNAVGAGLWTFADTAALKSSKPTAIHQKLNGYRKKNKLEIPAIQLDEIESWLSS